MLGVKSSFLVFFFLFNEFSYKKTKVDEQMLGTFAFKIFKH